MFTVLSKTYRLGINLDVEGLSGLDFFLTYFTWTLLPLHVMNRHSLLSGLAVADAVELLTYHPFLLSPSLHPQEVYSAQS